MRVAFFPGCLVDMFYPEVGEAAVHVLEKLGCQLEFPKEEVCCGQMFLNSGYTPETAAIAKQTIEAYSGYDTVVSLTGSCMHAIMEDYPAIFADDPESLPRAVELAGHFHEFTDFIVNTLGVVDVGAHLNAVVTYHKSCHLTRLLGIEEPPLALLGAVDGLTYVEMEHADRCCGFGGTFSVKEPEISGQIVREKCQTILDTGADVVVGADQPCLMNIWGCLNRMRETGETNRDVRVMHIAQVLDS